MGENNIPFETSLDDGMTVGIDAIIESLQRLDEMANTVGASLDAAFSGVGTAANDLGDLITNMTTRINAGFQRTVTAVRDGTTSMQQAFGDLGTSMDDLNSFAQSMDQQLFDVVNVLGDIKTNTELSTEVLVEMWTALDNISQAATTTNDALDTLSGQLDTLITAVKDLAEEAPAAAAGLNDVADAEEKAGAGASFFGAGASNMLAMMGGFQIFNLITRGIGGFVQMAIQGNAQMERMHVAIAAFMGDSAATDLVNWSRQFALTTPDTYMNIQKSLVALTALKTTMGANWNNAAVEHLQTDLATVAGTLNVTLPVAAQAFTDDVYGRVTMLQRQLHITNTELEQYGLKLGAKGKIDRQSLVAAFEAYVEHTYPGGLKQVMETYTGQLTNLTDYMQILAMTFGQPIFADFKKGLGDLLYFLFQNRQAIYDFATVLGNVFAGAINAIFPLIGQFITFLQNNHVALAALIGLLGGTFIGVILSVGVAIMTMLGPLFGIGSAIGALAGPIVAFVINSEPMQELLTTIWQAASDLADILGGLLSDALSLVTDLFGALVDLLFGSQQPTQQVYDQVGKTAGQLKVMGDAAKGAKGFLGELNTIIEKILGPVQTFATDIHNLKTKLDGLNGGKGLQLPTLDLSGAKNGLGDFFKNLGHNMEPLLLIGSTLLGVGAAFGLFKLGITNINVLLQAFHNWLQLAGFMLKNLLSPLEGVGGFLKGGFKEVLDQVVVRFQVFAETLSGGEGGLGGILAALQASMGDVGAALAGIGAAALPLIVIVVAIALAVTSVVYAFIHWWTTSENFRNAVMGLLGLLASLAGVLMGSLKQAWEQIQQTLQQMKPAWDGLVQAFDELKPTLLVIGGILLGVLAVALGVVFAVLKGLFMAIGPLLGGAFTALAGAFQLIAGIIELVVNLIVGLFKILKDIFGHDDKDLSKDWNDFLNGIVQSVGNILGGLGKIFAGIFGGLWGAVSGFVVGFVTGIIQWFGTLFEKLVGHSIVPDLISSIAQLFLKMLENIPIVGGLVSGVIGLFQQQRDGVTQAQLEQKAKSLQITSEQAMTQAVQYTDMAQQCIAEAQRTTNEATKQALLKKAQVYKAAAQEKEDVAKKAAEQAKEVADQAKKAKDDSGNFFTQMVGTIGNIMTNLASSMLKWATDAVGNFVKGLLAGAGQVAGAAGQLAGNVASALHFSKPDVGPLSDADTYMPDFVDLLARGIDSNKGKLAASAQGAAAAISSALTGMSSGGASAGSPLGASGAPGFLAAGNSGPTAVTVNMPNDFAAGFSMIDNSTKQAFVTAFRDEISRQLGQGTRTQGMYANGYSGYTKGT